MSKRAYAEYTKVPVTQSHNEIHKMLAGIGAERIGLMFGGDEGSIVVFSVGNTMYKISQPDLSDQIPDQDRAERAAWRAVVLLVKAKSVAIKQGISTVEQEFMANTVMPDGSLLIDHREQIIEHNYGQNGPPLIGFTARN